MFQYFEFRHTLIEAQRFTQIDLNEHKWTSNVPEWNDTNYIYITHLCTSNML